jgi:hypothetical protein
MQDYMNQLNYLMQPVGRELSSLINPYHNAYLIDFRVSAAS